MLYHYNSAHCCPLSLHLAYFVEHLRRSVRLWRHPAVNPSLRRERKRAQNLVGSVSRELKRPQLVLDHFVLHRFFKVSFGGECRNYRTNNKEKYKNETELHLCVVIEKAPETEMHLCPADKVGGTECAERLELRPPLR